MYISMNWIRDFVDLSGFDLNSLIQRFTLSTAEVEEITYRGEDLRDVVSAKIVSLNKHPESKKLHLLQVDAGDGIYDVVCGAPNVRLDMIIPFVKEGGRVGEMDIQCATLAGYDSHGMCCSEFELGISGDHNGLMDLPADTPLGVDIRELYDIRDIVFEVDNKSLTNRPDLWGHYGIAREFAAITGRPLKPLVLQDLRQYDTLAPIDIQVLDTENCFRYSGLKVQNITQKVSPVNMRIRLFYCGTRAINLLADLTNYLMLEMGQPMHAFDCAKVDRIEVQRMPAPFTFRTLDDTDREITPDTLMITSGNQPVAIAGIMGGLASEIEEETDTLLLESATFDAVSVRKSSTRLGLRTDASMRYEKTLDPEMTVTAIARFMALLIEIDPGVAAASSLTDVYSRRYPRIALTFDQHYVDRYTGITISQAQILNTLNALGFAASFEAGCYHVTVPTWRATKDVTMKADIIEEITRIYGYDNFEILSTVSLVEPVRRTEMNVTTNFVKDLLVQQHQLHEVNSYLWCDNKKFHELSLDVEPNVRLVNATTPEHEVLRNALVPSLLCFLPQNKSFAPEFGIFEIARSVEGLLPNGNADEHTKLGIVLYSRNVTEEALFLRLRQLVGDLIYQIKHVHPSFSPGVPTHNWQHPANTATIHLNDTALGVLNTLHPTVIDAIDKRAAIVCAEIDMGLFSSHPTADLKFEAPSKYPGIDIDLTLLLPDGRVYADLLPAWADDSLPLTDVQLIDTFEQGGEKNITLRFSFSSHTKTLSMEEVQLHVDRIIQNFAEIQVQLKK